MAIKIIKPGDVKKTRVFYEITCPICGCIFEVETEDFKKIERQLDGYCYIDCPTCSSELKVIRSKLKSREE